jgi:hypothetical protein
VAEFRDVGRTAFVGSVASSAVQGVLAGLGFALCGVEQPVTWAAVVTVASFIPVIGVPLVWVPLAVALVIEGHFGRAILLTAWCLLVVGLLNDYFLRPRLVGGSGRDAHPLLMLVAILGGISVFGVAGVIVGPVVMSLFVATARIYERERDRDAALTSGGAETQPSRRGRRRPWPPRAPRRSRVRADGSSSWGHPVHRSCSRTPSGRASTSGGVIFTPHATRAKPRHRARVTGGAGAAPREGGPPLARGASHGRGA